MQDNLSLTAPCGLDCFNCELHANNLTDQLAEFLHKKYSVSLEEVPCKGCRLQNGKHFHLSPEGCNNLICATTKGVELCCDCHEFPCAMIAPLADGADRYPHNIKLYNLCRIKKLGLEHWIEKEAGIIRNKYFNNTFTVGKGQAD